MRKPTVCMCEYKDADQLRGNREADQHLCFQYIDSTIPLFSKSEISLYPPQTVFVGGYTVYTLSVLPTVRVCVRNVLFP